MLGSPGSFRVASTPTDTLSSVGIRFHCFSAVELSERSQELALAGKFSGRKKKEECKSPQCDASTC